MDKIEKNTENLRSIGIILLILGVIITFAIMTFYPAENKEAGVLALIGAIVSTAGVYMTVKNQERNKRLLFSYGFLAIFVVLVFVADFVDIQNNNHPPRFATNIEKTENMIIYKTPFYKVYRINPNTQNEYYIVDQKEEFTKETIPTSEFNRVKSGIDKIINYRDQYVGNNTNDGNLIAHLPLSEYGYTFEIDSKNFGLTINYKTDANKIDELYLKKSLIYNSVSTFALIQNVQYLKINFGEISYAIERQEIEEKYPNYGEIVKDNVINIENFNKYLEDMIKDNEFVEETFSSMFSK